MATMHMNNARTVETHGVLETRAYKIAANGKAFKILIDKLYSDKPRAVVRELWTNALDAHVMEGNQDKPFECHLPTAFEPYFEVRDFGISMTHEGVMDLYSTVFESSKENTNEQAGQFGLGSKSPFAYTDTFTVTAWLDGEKRTYSAYIADKGMPMTSLMSREPSDEPQGVSVSFPVEPNDIPLFAEAARKIVPGFAVPPLMTGAPIPPLDLYIDRKGEGWRTFKKMATCVVRSAHARMGPVLYPIDPYAIPGAPEHVISLCALPMIIDFPIGSLDLVPSREALGYDATTCATITQRATKIAQEMAAEYLARFDSIRTFWDMLVFRREIIDNASAPSFIADLLKRKSFRGKLLGENNDYVSFRGLARNDIHITRIEKREMSARQRGPRLEKHNVSRTYGFHFDVDDVIVYHHDPEKDKCGYVSERIMAHYNTIRYSWGPSRILFVRARTDSVGFKRFLVKMGRPPATVFINVHDLPNIEPARRTRQPVKMKLIVNGIMEACDVDFEDGGFYIPLLRDDMDSIPPLFHQSVGLGRVSALFEALKTVGILSSDDRLYGMPRSLSKNAAKDGWYNFWEVAEAFFKSYYNENNVGVIATSRRVCDPTQYRDDHVQKVLRWLLCLETDNIEPADSTGALGELMAHVKMVRRMAEITAEEKLVEFNIDMTTLARPDPKIRTKLEEDLKTKAANFYKAYPMFTLLAGEISNWASLVNCSGGNQTEHALDYINLVDKYR